MTGTEERPAPGSAPWWQAGLRSVFTLCLLVSLASLSRCSQQGSPATPLPATAVPGTPGSPATPPPATPAPAASEPAFAHLRIEVEPAGALILVDGLRSGPAPLSLELPAGEHVIRAEQEGYEPLIWSVNLSAGSQETLTGRMVALAGAASPTPAPSPTAPAQPRELLADLIIRGAGIELERGGACLEGPADLGVRVRLENIGFVDAGPFAVEVNGVQVQVAGGLAAGQSTGVWVTGFISGGPNVVVADVTSLVPESNEENNVFSGMLPIPTPPVTCTPASTTAGPLVSATGTPAPTAAAASPVLVREDSTTIATYPFASFLLPARNEALGVPYQVLDRAAYEASGPVARPVSYRTLVVENDYLALTFLPEVGGRLYEVLYKPTGHRETYRNPVLKPSPWGPAEQGWWLAAGGFEWCLPVEEHGYEWGVPWTLRTARDDRGVSVILTDSQAPDRVRAEIVVRLEAGSGSFTVRPRLENPTGSAQAVKYWTNAMLAPGGRNAPSADLRFVLPEAVQSVTVHSRGDDFLPSYGQRLSWPVYQGLDLSRLGNWNRWLGFFEDPAAGGFMAVYEPAWDEGMVRVFPAAARGAKVFAFGWQDPIAPANWTDDGSAYVEIHGGPAATFDEAVSIPAGGHLEWTETWYPVAGLGGLRHANAAAALNLAVAGGQVHIAAAVTRPWSGQAVLLLDGQELWRQALALAPGRPFRHSLAPGAGLPAQGTLLLRLADGSGQVTAEYALDLGRAGN